MARSSRALPSPRLTHLGPFPITLSGFVTSMTTLISRDEKVKDSMNVFVQQTDAILTAHIKSNVYGI